MNTMAVLTTTTPADSSGEPRRIRVLCVDNHPDITAILRMILDAQPDLQCVGCLSSADTLVEEASLLGADVVLLDATMPGKNPFEASRELAAASPRTGTIIFSGWDAADLFERAVKSGARGCVSKHEDTSAILQVVRDVAAGRTSFPSPR